jgi:hypothetical protein
MKINRFLAISLLILPTLSHAETYQLQYTLAGGTASGDWVATDPKYGEWTANGELKNCNNWAPSISTVGKSIPFSQTATDCQQVQTRTVERQLRNTVTGKVEVIAGSATQESRTDPQLHSSTRDAIGILETWKNIDPIVSSWVTQGIPFDCAGWTPDPNDYTASITFSQMSSNCKVNQNRNSQSQEQEVYTGEIRNAGSPTIESQVLTGQTSTRSFKIQYSEWANTGEPFNCTDWVPNATTIQAGASFSQSHSCQSNGNRSREESYQELNGAWTKVSEKTEAQVITLAATTQQSVGTKPISCSAAHSSTYHGYIRPGGSSASLFVINGVSLSGIVNNKLIYNGITYTYGSTYYTDGSGSLGTLCF